MNQVGDYMYKGVITYEWEGSTGAVGGGDTGQGTYAVIITNEDFQTYMDILYREARKIAEAPRFKLLHVIQDENHTRDITE